MYVAGTLTGTGMAPFLFIIIIPLFIWYIYPTHKASDRLQLVLHEHLATTYIIYSHPIWSKNANTEPKYVWSGFPCTSIAVLVMALKNLSIAWKPCYVNIGHNS